MKKTTSLIVLIAALFALSSCVEYKPEKTTADQKDKMTVEQQQEVYNKAQPVPRFDYSLERDIVKQLYRARNEKVATHTVWRGDTSEVEGHCPSIGFPIPYDTSLTNPLKSEWKSACTTHDHSMASAVVEQPEPNGVFASKNSTATWVRCVVNGEEAPVYVEGKVTAYPYPVKVEGNMVTPVSGKKPTVTIKDNRASK